MIHGKGKVYSGHRQKCPPSLHPTLERAEGALPPVKEGGGGGGGSLCLKKGWKAGRKRDFSTLSPIREPVHRLTNIPDSLRRSILLEAVRAYCKLQTNLSGLFEIRWQDVWTWTCFCIFSLTCEYNFPSHLIAAREANFEWSKFLLDSETEGNQINRN